MKPGNGGLAGGGIYFATAPELTGHKAHKKGVILEATVALGKILTLDAAGDPTMTLQKLKSKEYDSVCIARAVSSGQEYVVYDPKQVLSICMHAPAPQYMIIYENMNRPARFERPGIRRVRCYKYAWCSKERCDSQQPFISHHVARFVLQPPHRIPRALEARHSPPGPTLCE